MLISRRRVLWKSRRSGPKVGSSGRISIVELGCSLSANGGWTRLASRLASPRRSGCLRHSSHTQSMMLSPDGVSFQKFSTQIKHLSRCNRYWRGLRLKSSGRLRGLAQNRFNTWPRVAGSGYDAGVRGDIVDEKGEKLPTRWLWLMAMPEAKRVKEPARSFELGSCVCCSRFMAALTGSGPRCAGSG